MKKIFTAGMLLASFAAVSLAHGASKMSHLSLKPTSPLVNSASAFFERKGFHSLALKASISSPGAGLEEVSSIKAGTLKFPGMDLILKCPVSIKI